VGNIGGDKADHKCGALWFVPDGYYHISRSATMIAKKILISKSLLKCAFDLESIFWVKDSTSNRTRSLKSPKSTQAIVTFLEILEGIVENEQIIK